MKAGDQLFYEVKVDGVKDVTITFSEAVDNIVITTEEVETVSWNFEGIAHSKLVISSLAADKVKQVILTLKIEEQGLLSQGIARNDLRVYLDGKELETVFDKTEDGYLYYVVTSPGIGEFVIGKAKVAIAVPVKEVTPVQAPSGVPVVQKTAEIIPLPEQGSPLVGKAAAQPSSEGMFQSIADFFKNLFK